MALSILPAACGGGVKTAQTVLDGATLQGIESGGLDLAFEAVPNGNPKNDFVVLTLFGPFQRELRGSLPQLDIGAKVEGTLNGEKIHLNGGLVLLPDSAYLDYKGVSYKVSPTVLGSIESTLEAGMADAAACPDEVSKLKVADLFENAKNEGRRDVAGAKTTEIRGDLNVSEAIDSLLEAAKDPSCRNLLTATGQLPSRSKIEQIGSAMKSSVRDAHIAVDVGDDGIVRQLEFEAVIEPRNTNASEGVWINLDLKINRVNEKQKISAPKESRPLGELPKPEVDLGGLSTLIDINSLIDG